MITHFPTGVRSPFGGYSSPIGCRLLLAALAIGGFCCGLAELRALAEPGQGAAALAQDSAGSGGSTSKPGPVGAAGQIESADRVVCLCTADTTVCNGDPAVRSFSAGGLQQVDVLGVRRFALFRFDVAKLTGLEITRATLRVRRKQESLTRVGISTIAADWQEGTSETFEAQDGAACFAYSSWNERPERRKSWGMGGGDVTDVIFGNGGSRWATARARFDDASRWYEIDVPPALVYSLVQGLQVGGLCLADDFNRDEPIVSVDSRESSNPPELVVETQRAGTHNSAAPTELRAYRDSLGLEWAAFVAPHALGFEVYLSDRAPTTPDDLKAARKLDTWWLPSPGGGVLKALISLHRDSTHRFVSVRAIEALGSWSPFVSGPLPPAVEVNPTFTAPKLPRHNLPTSFERPFAFDDGPGLSEDGRWMRAIPKTWWKPFDGPIALQAGRNEFVSFQVALCGGPGTYRVTLAGWQSPGAVEPAPRAELFRQHYVHSRLGQEKFAPEVAVPLALNEELKLDLLTPAAASRPAADPATDTATQPASQAASQPATQPVRRRVVQGVWVDLYVPHKAAPGIWRNRLIVLKDGQALLDLPIELEVLAPALPDSLNFAISLRATKLPAAAFGVPLDSPEAWTLLEDCHRLTHVHRSTLAVVPVRANGQVQPGFSPTIRAEGGDVSLDFTEWEQHFARYFDGSAFRDLPREAAPLDHFLLPFSETWPLMFRPKLAAEDAPFAARYHYRPTYTERRSVTRGNPPPGSYMVWPIEQAFDAEYKRNTQTLLKDFSKQISQRGWKTQFQIAPSSQLTFGGRSSWWLLREPQTIDDVLAERYWLSTYRQALPDKSSPIRLRADVSLPELSRGLLDGLLDIMAVNRTFFEKNRAILSAPNRPADIWTYDGQIDPELGFSAVQRWGWAARVAGAHGLMVSDAMGIVPSWDAADTTALLYPGKPIEQPKPCASLRLKVLRRVQQDCEWLEQWRASTPGDLPEGYFLSVLGGALVERCEGKTPRYITLLPIVEFPGQLDHVGFEEVRRGLRAAAVPK